MERSYIIKLNKDEYYWLIGTLITDEKILKSPIKETLWNKLVEAEEQVRETD